MTKNNDKLNFRSCSYKIRLATLMDLDEISDLEKMSFKYPYPQSLIHQLIRDRNAICMILEVEQKIIGYIFGIIRIGEKGHIVSIAIHSNYRNCNFGSILAEELLNFFKRSDISKIALEVRVSNKAAQNLYKKFNFQIEKIIHRYYLDGEDAYLMICIIE